jgi:hypothetical protein
MAKMTVEQWVASMKVSMEDNLRSVLLFGSTTSGDHAGALSDTNLLVVVKQLGLDDLRTISEVAAPWIKQGHLPPVFMTEQELLASADVFPIEYSDMEDARQVLFGEDLLAKLAFSKANLRIELEHEFRGALLRLRRALVATGMDRRRAGEVMLKSVSTFLVLVRSAVRLLGEKPPLKKVDALAILKSRVEFDDEVLRLLDDARHQGADPREVAEYLGRYLAALETLTSWIDRESGAA